jgi:hypothetical protein
MNKINDTSLFNFQEQFPDEEACLNFLAELKWEDGFVCPKCGHTNYCRGKRKQDRQCTSCHRVSSPTSGTLFHMVKFPILQAFYIVYLIINNNTITSTKLSQLLGLRQKTCWLFKRKVLMAIGNKRHKKIIPISSSDAIKENDSLPIKIENKTLLERISKRIKIKNKLQQVKTDFQKLKSQLNNNNEQNSKNIIVSFLKKAYSKVRTKKTSGNISPRQIAFDLIIIMLVNSEPILYQNIRKIPPSS